MGRVLQVAAAGSGKKLVRAAELWATGGPSEIDEQPLEALRQWGATEAQVAEWRGYLRQQAVEDECQVWPEHWHAVQLLVAMSTQWRSAGVGMAGLLWTGLDYGPLPEVNQAVRCTLPRRLRRRWRTVFAQLQTLEAAAMSARNRG